MPLILTSTAFHAGNTIPAIHTCDGEDVSPPLSWTGVPDSAKSLALIVDDPDAPDPAAPKMTWVHWILYNISTNTSKLPQGLQPPNLPPGTCEGINDWKRTGYRGPCPPVGQHRYIHKLYALDAKLPNLGHPRKAELENAMRGHIIEQAELIGLYQQK
jgi:Raf kinase inhibitor-like YbhB/YbcL family protein